MTIRSKWLITGGETLLGKEIRDLVEERKLPVELTLAAARPDERVLTATEGELEVLAPLDDASISDSTVVILAGAATSHVHAKSLLHKGKKASALVDATGALEDDPKARICAPVLNRMPERASGGVHVPAHPAAVALARLMLALKNPMAVKNCVVTVYEPASEYGRDGLNELHQQAISLFAFKALPQEVFDCQVAFSLRPRYGEEAPLPLSAVETRIEKHIASLLGPEGVHGPSLRLVHAPVFHGYVMSVWVELEGMASESELGEALTAAGFEVRGPDVEPGSNTGVAGQSGITASDIARDRNNPHACWLWLAFDNLRAHADNVLLTAAWLSRETAK